MAYSKPDSKLVSTPIEELCGDPKSRTGIDTERGGVNIEGTPKESTSETIETVTYVTGLGAGTEKSS